MTVAPPGPRGVVVTAGDPALRRSLVEQLTAAGRWPVDAAAAAVLVAVIDGAEAAAAARRAHADGIRVVALAEAAAVEAPASWGFPVLPLPVRLAELVAAVERAMALDPAGRAIGAYRYHPAGRRLEHPPSGRTLRLTEIECRIIEFLLSAGDRPVSREALLADVWGYAEDATTHTVATHIYRLRRKLGGGDAGNPLLSGPEGYRLAR